MTAELSHETTRALDSPSFKAEGFVQRALVGFKITSFNPPSLSKSLSLRLFLPGLSHGLGHDTYSFY